MANDLNRDLLPVKDVDDRSSRVSTGINCRMDHGIIAKLKRCDLEDRYMRLYDENTQIKKQLNSQEEKIKRLGTKLLRLIGEKKNCPDSCRRRQDGKGMDELQMRIIELEHENYTLKDRNVTLFKVLKQQLANHARQHVAAHRSPNRSIHNSPRMSQRQPSAQNVNDGNYILSNRNQAHDMQLREAEEHINGLNEEIKSLHNKIDILQQDLEKSSLENQKTKVCENIELIRLQRSLRQQSVQIAALQAQIKNSEKNQKLLRDELASAHKENEESLQIISDKQKEILDLYTKLEEKNLGRLECEEMKERIKDLTSERDSLRERGEFLMRTIESKSSESEMIKDLKKHLASEKSKKKELKESLENTQKLLQSLKSSASKGGRETSEGSRDPSLTPGKSGASGSVGENQTLKSDQISGSLQGRPETDLLTNKRDENNSNLGGVPIAYCSDHSSHRGNVPEHLQVPQYSMHSHSSQVPPVSHPPQHSMYSLPPQVPPVSHPPQYSMHSHSSQVPPVSHPPQYSMHSHSSQVPPVLQPPQHSMYSLPPQVPPVSQPPQYSMHSHSSQVPPVSHPPQYSMHSHSSQVPPVSQPPQHSMYSLPPQVPPVSQPPQHSMYSLPPQVPPVSQPPQYSMHSHSSQVPPVSQPPQHSMYSPPPQLPQVHQYSRQRRNPPAQKAQQNLPAHKAPEAKKASSKAPPLPKAPQNPPAQKAQQNPPAHKAPEAKKASSKAPPLPKAPQNPPAHKASKAKKASQKPPVEQVKNESNVAEVRNMDLDSSLFTPQTFMKLTIEWLRLAPNTSVWNDESIQFFFVDYGFFDVRGENKDILPVLKKPENPKNKCLFNFTTSIRITRERANCLKMVQNRPKDTLIVFILKGEPSEPDGESIELGVANLKVKTFFQCTPETPIMLTVQAVSDASQIIGHLLIKVDISSKKSC